MKVMVNGRVVGRVIRTGPHHWRAEVSPGVLAPGPPDYHNSRQATQALVATALIL